MSADRITTCTLKIIRLRDHILRRYALYILFSIIIFITAAVTTHLPTDTESHLFPSVTPWQSIGGCGVSGNGSSNGQSIEWTGRGVKGYLFSMELLPRFQTGRIEGHSGSRITVSPRLVWQPTWQTMIDLTLPFNSIHAEIQPQTNFAEEVHLNSGTGDLSIGIRHHFGPTGSLLLHGTCTFPTGSWDRQYGAEQSRKILPPSLQTGQGIYTATIGGRYYSTFDDGYTACGAMIFFPFNIRFDGKNEYLDSYYSAYSNVTVNKERFYYDHIIKPYGESDRGDYIPPSLQFSFHYANTSSSIIVHSVQCTFDAALGTRWQRAYEPYRYAPYPDPAHAAWSLFIAYGLEYSGFSVPFFTGIGLPISDRYGPDNRWDGIATKDLFNNWIFTTGITFGIY